MTLLEKWNDLQTIVKRRSDSIVQAAYPSIPSEFYCVYPTGKIEVRTTKGSHYTFSFSTYPSGKKPTQKDVIRLTEALSIPTEVDPMKIYIEYSAPFGESTSTSWSKAKDLFDEKGGLFLCLEKANAESVRVSEKWKAEKEFDQIHKKDAGYRYDENGYKFLGWQNGWHHVYFDADGQVTTDPQKKKSFGYLTSDYPEYGKCKDAGHRTIHVQHNPRGSENTVSCPICKVYWKYDSSD